MTIAVGQPFSLVVGGEASEDGIFGELMQVSAVGSPAAGFNTCTNASGGGPQVVYQDAIIAASALLAVTRPSGAYTNVTLPGTKIYVPAFSLELCSFYGWYTNGGTPYLAYWDYAQGKLYCVLDIPSVHFVQLAGF